jgi:4-amino-4-deoxy-L-arabinose transferase-like glycosyltransferase
MKRLTLNRRAANWILILLIAVAAIALRVYAIDRLPPGLFADESVEGLDALDVMAGNLNIWFHSQLGREPIYVYLVALSYQIFGVTPLATRLPSIIAGLATIPATFFLVREWAIQLFERARATRLALLSTGLLAISFWHIQMTRDAHRDTLLPLVEAIGYFFLWRGMRTRDWRYYAGAGAILGLAIYTYSPGRFVSIFIAAFFVIELAIHLAKKSAQWARRFQSPDLNWRGLVVAGLLAIGVMLPLGIYFAYHPEQFSRRFESVSVFDQASPADAFTSSVTGNLAQFVVPDAGYQSKHYNLPGTPVFDLLIAPWFLAGLVIALWRWKQSAYRFLLLWFAVMMVPAFLTADMIPKGVRVLGIVPGVFIFPALAMDELCFRFQVSGLRSRNTQYATRALIVLCILGSALWTTYDYFVAWANLPELPLSFDADMTEVADFIHTLPPNQPIYISQQVYRPPTLMLLGELVPTTRYVDRATRFKEADAHTALFVGAQVSDAAYVFVRDDTPPNEWLTRIAPEATQVTQGKFFTAYRFGKTTLPQRSINVDFNPYLKLVGASRFNDDPRGIVLYWQVAAYPSDRQDIDAVLSITDSRGNVIAQSNHRFGVPPLEWGIGDTIADWYEFDSLENTTQFSIQFKRGDAIWKSPLENFK